MAEHVDRRGVAVEEPEPVEQAPGPGPWARTSAFGFLVILAAVASSVITSIIDQVNAFALMISGIVAIVALLGAWLAASGRRGRLVAAVLLALLALAGNAEGLWGLALPGSFWDFAPVVLFLVGALTALVAGIAALRRLDTDAAASVAAERRVRQAVVGGLGVVLVISAVLSLTGGTTVSDELRAGAIEVSADDFAFAPDVIDGTPGDAILVVNDDIFYHTFTIDELGIDVSLMPGDEALVAVPDDATGSYEFYCTPHVFGEGEGMIGSLQVGA